MANPKQETPAVMGVDERLTGAAERIGETQQSIRARQSEEEKRRADAQKTEEARSRAAEEAKEEAARAADAVAARKENALSYASVPTKRRMTGSRKPTETPEEAQARKDAMAEMLEKEKKEAAERAERAAAVMSDVKEASAPAAQAPAQPIAPANAPMPTPAPIAPSSAPAPSYFNEENNEYESDESAPEEWENEESQEPEDASAYGEPSAEEQAENDNGNENEENNDTAEDGFDGPAFDPEDLFDEDESDAITDSEYQAPAADADFPNLYENAVTEEDLDEADFAEAVRESIAAREKKAETAKEEAKADAKAEAKTDAWQKLLTTYLDANRRSQDENNALFRDAIEGCLRTMAEANSVNAKAFAEAIAAKNAPAEQPAAEAVQTAAPAQPIVVPQADPQSGSEDRALMKELIEAVKDGNEATRNQIASLGYKQDELAASAQKAAAPQEGVYDDVLRALADAVKYGNVATKEQLEAIAAMKEGSFSDEALTELGEAIKQTRADTLAALADVTDAAAASAKDGAVTALASAAAASGKAPDTMLALERLTEAIKAGNAEQAAAIASLAAAPKAKLTDDTLRALISAIRESSEANAAAVAAAAKEQKSSLSEDAVKQLTDAIRESVAAPSKETVDALIAALKTDVSDEALAALTKAIATTDSRETDAITALAIALKSGDSVSTVAALTEAVKKDKPKDTFTDMPHALANALRGDYPTETVRRLTDAVKQRPATLGATAAKKLAVAMKRGESAKVTLPLVAEWKNTNRIPSETAQDELGQTLKASVPDANAKVLTDALRSRVTAPADEKLATLALAFKDYASIDEAALFLCAVRSDKATQKDADKLARALKSAPATKTYAAVCDAFKNSDVPVTEAAVDAFVGALKETKELPSAKVLSDLADALKNAAAEKATAAFLDAIRGETVLANESEITALTEAMKDSTSARILSVLDRSVRAGENLPSEETLVALTDALNEKVADIPDETVASLAKALRENVSPRAAAALVIALRAENRVPDDKDATSLASSLEGEDESKIYAALTSALTANRDIPTERALRALTEALENPDVLPEATPAAPVRGLYAGGYALPSDEYRSRMTTLRARLTELTRQRDGYAALKRSGTADERYTRALDIFSVECAIIDTLGEMILISSASGKSANCRKFSRRMKKEIDIFNFLAKKKRRILGFRPKRLTRDMPKQIVAEGVYTPLSRAIGDEALADAIKALAKTSDAATSDEGLFTGEVYAGALSKRTLTKRERRYNERRFKKYRKPQDRRLAKLRAERDKCFAAAAPLEGEKRVESEILLLEKQAEIVNLTLSVAREAYLFSLDNRVYECGSIASEEISTYNKYLASFNLLTERNFLPLSENLIEKIKCTGTYTPIRPLTYRKEDFLFDKLVKDTAQTRTAAREKHAELYTKVLPLDATVPAHKRELTDLILEAVACEKTLCETAFALLESASVFDLKEAKAKWALESAAEIELYNKDVAAAQELLEADFFTIDPRVIGNIIRLKGCPVIPTLVWNRKETKVRAERVPSTKEAKAYARFARRRERRIETLTRIYKRAARREARISAKPFPSFTKLNRVYRVIIPCLTEIINLRLVLLRKACRLKLQYQVELQDRKTRDAIALYCGYLPNLNLIYDKTIEGPSVSLVTEVENGFKVKPLANIYSSFSLRPLSRSDRFRRDHSDLTDEISTLRLERGIRVEQATDPDRAVAVGAGVEAVNLTAEIAERLITLMTFAKAFGLPRYKKMYAGEAKEELALYNTYVTTLNGLAGKAFPTVSRREIRRVARRGLDVTPYKLDYSKERYVFEVFLGETEPKLAAAVAKREEAKRSLARLKPVARTYADRLHFSIAAVSAQVEVVNVCYTIAERAFIGRVADMAEIYAARITSEWDEYDSLITAFNALTGETFPLADRSALELIRACRFYLPMPEFNYEKQLLLDGYIKARKPALDRHRANIVFLQKKVAGKRGRRSLPLYVAIAKDQRAIANTLFEILDRASEFSLPEKILEYSVAAEYATDAYNSTVYRLESLTREDLPVCDKSVIEDIKARRYYKPIAELALMNDIPLPGKYTSGKERRFIRFAIPRRKKLARLRKQREALRAKEIRKSGVKLIKLNAKILDKQREIVNLCLLMLDRTAALKLYDYNESYCLECENEIDLYNEYIEKLNDETGNEYAPFAVATAQAVLDRKKFHYVDKLKVTFSHTQKETVQISDRLERTDIAYLRARRAFALRGANRELFDVSTDYGTKKNKRRNEKLKRKLKTWIDVENEHFEKAEVCEIADNERYFRILRTDVENAKFPRRAKADRGILSKQRDSMRALLKERDELNEKLVILYQSIDGSVAGATADDVAEAYRLAQLNGVNERFELVENVREMPIDKKAKDDIVSCVNYRKSLIADIEADTYLLEKSNLRGAAEAQVKDRIKKKKSELRYVDRKLARMHEGAERAVRAKRMRPWITALVVLLILGAAAAVVYFGFWPQISDFFAKLFGKA